jgi:hypothetical protein
MFIPLPRQSSINRKQEYSALSDQSQPLNRNIPHRLTNHSPLFSLHGGREHPAGKVQLLVLTKQHHPLKSIQDMKCLNKKMTLGWVVNGGRRHAELHGDLIPHGYWVK